MKLKVCGMKYNDNIVAVADLQPDYMGFIFYDKSARFSTSDLPDLPKGIKKVGVFVDATPSAILEKVNKHQLDAIQLHGDESPEFCKEIKDALYANSVNNILGEEISIEIIKAFSVDNDFDFSALKPYESCCDYYLFDTRGKLPGGNGYVFNWNVLNNYPSTQPYFLSGGIGIEEIENIQNFEKNKASKYCFALDVNSKFEIKPGLKDVNLIREFKSKL